MELVVEKGEPTHGLDVGKVGPSGELFHLDTQALEVIDLAGAEPSGCTPCHKSLDQGAQVVDAFNIETVPVDNACPSVGDHLNEALGLQSPQTLADWCATEFVLSGKFRFGKVRAGGDCSGDYFAAK
ncbi:unannotated protein [freshwater metagenome]|uniref:Unannotated protein n=1 Tax=freshwater metagenome TaxID=449393 RepID=A0A6J7L5S5_9ZZZZ